MLKDVETYLMEQVESFNQAPSSDFDNVVTERVYWLKKQYRDIVKKAIQPGDRGLNDDGYLTDYNFKAAVAYDILTVIFSQRVPNGLFPAIRIVAGSTSQYYLESTSGVLPLWQVKKIRTGSKDYLTNWNYSLATKGLQPIPDWWETATDAVIPPDDKENYRWISEPSQLLEGWYIAINKTKAGVGGKRVYDVAIRKEKYVRDLNGIEQEVLNKQYIATIAFLKPRGFQSYGHNDGEWFVAPSSASPEQDLIKITTMFYHADEWDKDLYGDLRTS